MGLISAAVSYRGFILASVKREFQSKYRNSLLGVAWMILNPAAMIVVYTVIFSQVMKARLPGMNSAFAYSIYLCSGVLTWALFAEITGRCVTVFLENANLIKKISFPRIALPIVAILGAGLNFAIIFGLFTVFLVASGNFPGIVFLAIIPVLAIQILFSVGLGIVLGMLNVFFRDVGQLFGIVLQFWFWLTPIIYPISVLPPGIRPLISLNPMASLMAAYQNIIVNAQWPRWETLFPVTGLALLLCLIGIRLFRRHAGEMVDEL